jgi:hypothetical protein
MSEKKHLKRYIKSLRVRYGLEKPEKLAFTEDISMTGLSIRTHEVVKPGSVIVAELYLSDDTKILIKGCVTWAKKLLPAMAGETKKEGMGIKIVKFLSDGESVWKKYIESCADLQKAGECSTTGSQDIHNTLNMLPG